MNRAWGLGFVILVGCGAPASAQSPAGTSIQDALRIHTECEDAPPSEPKLMPESLVDDVLLVGLDACTQTLKEPGELGIARVFNQDSPSPSVYVTKSTIHECRVVECVKDHLAQLRASSVAPTTVSATRHFELALVPRERSSTSTAWLGRSKKISPAPTPTMSWPSSGRGTYLPSRFKA